MKSTVENLSRSTLTLGLLISVVGLCVSSPNAADRTTLLHFEVRIKEGLVSAPLSGRLVVLLGRNPGEEPRNRLGDAGSGSPYGFAIDATNFLAGPLIVNQSAFGYPLADLSRLPARDYVVQAVLLRNVDLRTVNAPGNLYSKPQKVRVDPAVAGTIRIDLTAEVSPEVLPADTETVKYLQVKSEKLSAFFGRPIHLRASVLLPKDYREDSSKRYPLWIWIGGYGTRYTVLKNMLRWHDGLREFWEDEKAPKFIILQLDGAGPFGDPYYVDSAVNGPYGEALMRELLPEVDEKFRTQGTGKRVLSGTSTGGWVSLALQLFYPDEFAGAWASCPDPVDFREMETTDIYREPNIYLNRHGYDRPSARDLDGDIRYTLRDEIRMERLLGQGSHFLLSGQQWGSWHGVYSPKDTNGLAKSLFNVETGVIDRSVAEHWKKYDLRLYTEANWKVIGPKLRGKLHISAGESDEYFLANAIRLFDRFLKEADPPAEAEIVYGPGEGHGWSHLSLRQMADAMHQAVGGKD